MAQAIVTPKDLRDFANILQQNIEDFTQVETSMNQKLYGYDWRDEVAETFKADFEAIKSPLNTLKDKMTEFIPHLEEKANTLDEEYLVTESSSSIEALKKGIGLGSVGVGAMGGSAMQPLRDAIANSQGANIMFAPGINSKVVSPYTKQILSEIGKDMGTTEVKITSTKRNLDQQINAMYNYINRPNSDARKKYKLKGQEIIKAHDQAVEEGKSKEEIKSAMKDKAIKNGFVSTHMSPQYDDLNAVDIGFESNKWGNAEKKKFEEAVNNANRKLPKNMQISILKESDCFHLDMPQPKYKNLYVRDLADLKVNTVNRNEI
ncbi:MAG: hypothetical protein FWG84_01490 [Bacteroidales bacterium]|nr:hypothetical protein [Bacteroidales bacterium]